jgi:hypothetical protein
VTGNGQGAFVASGAVGRYWLAHCAGFEACSEDGRLSGLVESVELDYAGRAKTLHVDRDHGRPLDIGIAAVTAVDPWEQLVVVALPAHQPRTAPVRAASAAAVRGGQTAWTGTARAGAASLAAVAASRRAAPPARRLAHWVGVRTAYALALAGWLYGVIAFTASRIVVRALAVVLVALARLGLWIAPRVGHAVGATTHRAVGFAGTQVHRAQQSARNRPSRGGRHS